jgi:hypothetical protein
MDKTQYIFIDIPTAQTLISEKKNGDGYRTDELITAIFLCKFCEKIWKTPCAIGIPLKHSEAKSIPLVGSSDLAKLKDILYKKTEQVHDVDALIVKRTPDNPNRSGQGFQIKRFNTYQKDLTTEGLIKYIESLRYAKTDTALVVLLETDESTKFTQIRNSINFSKFPFSALYFVTLHRDTLKFIEVWPNLGKEELDWNSV